MVAAWMSALTGVGPSIASGNQVCSGTCALFAAAPTNSSSATAVATPLPTPRPSGAVANTPVKSSVPSSRTSRKAAITMPMSPITLTTNAFFAAATAAGRW
jgi:hypothetical protein